MLLLTRLFLALGQTNALIVTNRIITQHYNASRRDSFRVMVKLLLAQGNLARGSWGGDEHHQLVSLCGGGEGVGIHEVMVT